MNNIVLLDFLHQCLDESPDDWYARAVLADIYEEMGDIERAKVQRWLIVHKKHPGKHQTHRNPNGWYFWADTSRQETKIGFVWFAAINNEEHWKANQCAFDTRQQAEDALIGFTNLSPE